MNESEDWKERRLLPLLTNHPSMKCSELLRRKEKYFDSGILSTFLPQVLQKIGNIEKKTYTKNFFMCVKILGIVDVGRYCENNGQYNPFKFLCSLEEFFDPILQVILSKRGDIVKWLPDEMWCVWIEQAKVSEVSLKNQVREVIDCALHIHRIRDKYEIKEGILLRVKIGISLGDFTMYKVDHVDVSHWIFSGNSISEAKEAVHISVPGEILLSIPEELIFPKYYYITEEYTKFIKVLGVGPNWKESNVLTNFIPLIDGQFVPTRTSSEETLFNIIASASSGNPNIGVNLICLEKADILLRTLPRPLYKSLLLGKPLDDLAKMKVIVVMHISIDMKVHAAKDRMDLIEVIIRTICSIIHNRDGFLYRTKIGTSNIQTIFVFGNIEQKVETNCREALNNAEGALMAFSKLQEVVRISVAITSGVAYCGVLNTYSRKSYILVCSAFKIASKLLKLYPGKIVCDKKTILHSRMRLDLFMLLEYQPLKNYEPGPVFQYLGIKLVLRMHHSQEEYLPFLANEDIIHRLRESFVKFSSGLHWRRDGKYISPDDSNVFIIIGEEGQGKTSTLREFLRVMGDVESLNYSLNSSHKMVPFYIVRKIFERILGLNRSISSEQKHTKLEYLIRELELTDYKCSLNDVFSTNFEELELYRCTHNEKLVVLEFVLKEIAYKHFDRPYIVALDEGQFLDDASCSILHELVEAKLIFLVMTMTRKRDLSVEVERFMKRFEYQHIQLKDFEENDQISLACQILNVHAISSDLKRYVHNLNTGNPGEIEAILSDKLVQNELVLKYIRHDEMDEKHFAIPLYIRHNDKRPLDEKITLSSRNLQQRKFTENSEEKKNIHPEYFPVCSLAPQVTISDHQKSTNNNKILSSFEALTKDQKQILQAASILSEAFPRSILDYVLNLKFLNKTQLDVSEDIQYLFELRILCCAKYQIPEKRCVGGKIFRNIPNKCDCFDSNILDLYAPNPKYSVCQFLRFISSNYKETVRKNIIPEISKGFNERALKYLKKETRHCNACGNGLLSVDHFEFDTSIQTHPEEPCFVDEKCETNIIEEENGRDTCMNYRICSQRDYKNCECDLILCSVYKQMVEHYKGLEQYLEMCKCIIKYAEISLISMNYEKAISLLKNGFDTIRPIDISSSIPNLNHLESIMYSLTGRIQLELHEREAAFINLCKSMELLGEPFPSTDLVARLKLYTLRIKKKSSFPSCAFFLRRGGYSESMAIQIRDLNGLFKFYKSKNNWKRAELAIIWSITKTNETAMNLGQVVETITNMIKLAIHRRAYTISESFMNHGLKLCKKVEKLDRGDIQSVVKFYSMCFFLKFHQDTRWKDALCLANSMINIAITINSTSTILSSTPHIVLSMIFRKNIPEAQSLLRRLEYYSVEFKHRKGMAWFYITNIILQLETGYAVVSFSDCEACIKAKETRKHVTSLQRMKILIWLWYVRNERWIKSFELFKDIVDYVYNGQLMRDKMSWFLLYVFEGVLLYAVHRSRRRNFLLEYRYEEEVMEICRKISATAFSINLQPRFTHLKAYYELCKNDEKSNLLLLEKAVNLCNDTGNLLEFEWIENSKHGWFNNLPDFLKDSWVKNIDNINPEKITYFTLPLPIH